MKLEAKQIPAWVFKSESEKIDEVANIEQQLHECITLTPKVEELANGMIRVTYQSRINFNK